MRRFRHLTTPQHLSFLLAMAIVPVLFWLSSRGTEQLVTANRWVEHTYTVLTRIERISNHVELVENARRGYVLTRQEQYLRPYYYALEHVEDDLREIRILVKDNPRQVARLNTVVPLVQGLTQVARHTVEKNALTRAEQDALMDNAKSLIEDFRARMDDMRVEEQELLATRTADSAYHLDNLRLWMNVMSVGFVLLLLYSFATMFREIGRRHVIEQGLREAQAVNEMTVSNLTLMGEMTGMLQACANVGEALEVISQFISKLINVDAGAIYLFRESRNQIEVVSHWGLPIHSAEIFGPDDCWALRRGEPHLVDRTRSPLLCKHMHAGGAVSSLCMPIVAQGNVLGILHLETQSQHNIDEALRLAEALASQVALALAGIKLRDTLSNLSVRDPLTGLFNRRYMEESLQREIAVAERQQQPLTLAILDLDHFKRFNDTFGHEAGDLLLRKAANLLSSKCRATDIACRFGGEEFVIIYPTASLEDALMRTNELREGIYALQLQHFGRSLGQVSASFGLAAFPQHGSKGEELLRNADQALYRAKELGRNRVEIAKLQEAGSAPAENEVKPE